MVRLRSLPAVKLVMAASSCKPAWLLRKSRFRGGQTLATWIGHEPSNLQKSTARHSGEREHMSVRQAFLAAATVSIGAFTLSPSPAPTVRYANPSEPKSL